MDGTCFYHSLWLQLGFSDAANDRGPETSSEGVKYGPLQVKYNILMTCIRAAMKASSDSKKIDLSLSPIDKPFKMYSSLVAEREQADGQ